MSDYRLYFLSGDGTIGLADWIAASTDEEAIIEVRKAKPEAALCEIWLKDRLVAKVSGKSVERFPEL